MNMRNCQDFFSYHFAWIPTKLWNGQFIWFKNYKRLNTRSYELENFNGKKYFPVENSLINDSYEKYNKSEKLKRKGPRTLWWHYYGGRMSINDHELQRLIVVEKMNQELNNGFNLIKSTK